MVYSTLERNLTPQRYTANLLARLTPDQKLAVVKHCRIHGIQLSEWLRATIRRALEKETP